MFIQGYLLICNSFKYLLFVAILFCISLKTYAQANIDIINFEKGDNIDFSAREVFYDGEKNIIEARGKVTAIWKEQTVTADIFRYYAETDEVLAFGNVRLINEEGYIVRTKKLELSGDFKNAVSDKLTSRLPNGSIIAAQNFKRKDGQYNYFYNAIYAPCAQCLQNDQKPLWSIKSKKVTHNEESQYITAQNVTFNIYGQPILWLPWFAYPDPTIDRKSGLLSPGFGYQDEHGIYGSFPIFLVINDHADLTLKPFLYEKNNIRLESKYRQRFKGGAIDLSGSIIRDKTASNNKDIDNIRWETDSSLYWRFADNWYLSSNIRSASDENYLNYFDIAKEADKAGFLRSDFTIERQSYNSWLQIQSLYFQTQSNTIKQEYIPTVLPELTFDWINEKDKFGGNAYLSLQSRSLYRDSPATNLNKNIFAFDSPKTSHRFISNIGWNKSWIGLLGEEYSFDVSATGLSWLSEDYYSNSIDYSGNQNLIRPKIETEISYPLIRASSNNAIHLEPVVQTVWSPKYNDENYTSIPNEDSHIFELTSNNLFSSNRFSGYDREEGGFRINYGLRGSINLKDNKYSRFTIGQVWRPTYDDEFKDFKNSGLDKEFSDIVAQIEASPYTWFYISSNGRFSQDDFSPRRLDIGGSIGPSSFKLSGYYIWFDDLEDNKVTEEIKIGLSSRLTDQLHFNGYIINDLQATDSKPKEARASLFWENESVAIGGYYKREWNASVEEDSLGIQLNLKTLGSFNFDL